MPTFLAPLLAQGLSLIANAAVVKGKDWVKTATGIDLDQPTISDEDLLKLKQYEMDHEEELLKLNIEDNRLELERDKAYLADVASARNMQIEAIHSTDWFTHNFTYLFISFWSFFAVGYIGWITFGHIPEENTRFADTILGFLLGTLVAQIFSYLLGSTRSSAAKDETLKTAVKAIGGSS